MTFGQSTSSSVPRLGGVPQLCHTGPRAEVGEGDEGPMTPFPELLPLPFNSVCPNHLPLLIPSASPLQEGGNQSIAPHVSNQ